MSQSKRIKIFEIIREKGQARPHDLAKNLQITPAALHRHLLKLLSEKKIEKMGKPPLVYYRVISPKRTLDTGVLSEALKEFINQRYLYISPEGKLLYGVEGFQEWVLQTKEEKQFLFLAKEYQKIRLEADLFYKNKEWIEATQKFKQTFPKVYLDTVIYEDFYSLPKFGKTKLGQLVLHAKQAQDVKLIDQLASQNQKIISKIIKEYRIQAIGFIPHSIPRKIPFLKEFKNSLPLGLPMIQIVKVYTGEIPVAQKSLSKLEERMFNAQNTIIIKDEVIPFKKILLIDDAVGSGATLNEVAKKLKQKGDFLIIGYAIVGSYKGFEVIKEV